MQGYGTGDMAWQRMPSGNYAISASRGGTVLWQAEAASGEDGRLSLAIPASAIEPLDISITCAAGAKADH